MRYNALVPESKAPRGRWFTVFPGILVLLGTACNPLKLKVPCAVDEDCVDGMRCLVNQCVRIVCREVESDCAGAGAGDHLVISVSSQDVAMLVYDEGGLELGRGELVERETSISLPAGSCRMPLNVTTVAAFEGKTGVHLKNETLEVVTSLPSRLLTTPIATGSRAQRWSVVESDVSRLQARDGVMVRSRFSRQTSVPTSTAVPGRRIGHGVAYDRARDRVVVFGGVVPGGDDGVDIPVDDLWEWDGRDWSKVQVAGEGPSRRSAFGMVYDAFREEVVLHGGGRSFDGGRTPGVPLDSTWVWRGERWEKRNELSPLDLSARIGPQMAYDSRNQRVLLFGGETGSVPDVVRADDLWAWDGQTWSALAQGSNQKKPPARSEAGVTFHEQTGQLMIFGGQGQDNPLWDLWLYTDEAGWTEVGFSEDGWPESDCDPGSNARSLRALSLVYQPALAKTVLLGGSDAACVQFANSQETYLWDGTQWEKDATVPCEDCPVVSPGLFYHSGEGRTMAFGGANVHGSFVGEVLWVRGQRGWRLWNAGAVDEGHPGVVVGFRARLLVSEADTVELKAWAAGRAIGSGSDPQSGVDLRLWSATQGIWADEEGLVESTRSGLTELEWRASGDAAVPYFNAGGEIHVLLRTHTAGTETSGAEVEVDCVELTMRRGP